MSRITRHQMFMRMAHVVAERSTCARLNAGAVVVVDKRIVGYGYNGQEPGAAHCNKVCQPGQCHTIHAEVNALRNVPWVTDLPLVMYVTDSPCANCAIDIADAMVKELYFSAPYRDTTPLDWLMSKGVRVHRLLPAGHIVDWGTGTRTTPVFLAGRR